MPGDFESEVRQVKAAREAARLEMLSKEAEKRDREEAAEQARIIERATRENRINLEIEKVNKALEVEIRSAVEYLNTHQMWPLHRFHGETASRQGWIIEFVRFCYDHKVTRTRNVRIYSPPTGWPNDDGAKSERVTETFTEWSVNWLEGYALCADGTIYTFYSGKGDSRPGGIDSYYLGNPLSPRRVIGIDLSDPLSPRRRLDLSSLAGSDGGEICADWLGSWRQKLIQLAARDGNDPASGPMIRPISEVEAQAARNGRLKSLIVESGWRPLPLSAGAAAG
jgi:hypothetical protein